MLRQLQKIFPHQLYGLIACLAAALVFSVAVWLPNASLVGEVLVSDTASTVEKMSFLFSLYGSIVTNFTLASALSTVLIAVLFGIYSAVLIYYIRSVRTSGLAIGSTSALGIGGVVSGFFSIGCAACGTFILSSLLTVGSASIFLSFLPFGGQELGFIGIGLLSYAIYSLLKKLQQPLVCDSK